MGWKYQQEYKILELTQRLERYGRAITDLSNRMEEQEEKFGALLRYLHATVDRVEAVPSHFIVIPKENPNGTS